MIPKSHSSGLDAIFDAAYDVAAAAVAAVLPNRRAAPEVHRAALKMLPAMAAARPWKLMHDESKLGEALRCAHLAQRSFLSIGCLFLSNVF